MRFIKPLAAALTLAIGATSFVGTADANHRRHHYYYGHHGHHHGNAVAAGVFGFAAGALLSGALVQPRYYHPAPVYYSSCAARFRSWNPQTGYYLGYDGAYHYCR